MSYLEAHERLWKRVDVRGPTECWNWQGAINSHGYGTIRQHCVSRGAHVVAYESRVGPVPKGLCVCHTCDNRRCCNPAHHFLGTKGENNADRDAKGRGNWRTGDDVTQAKMTNAEAALVRHLLACGVRQVPLARLYGVSQMAISNIGRAKSWRSVSDLVVPQ